MLMVFLSTTIIFAQAMHAKQTGMASTTKADVEKMEKLTTDNKADIYSIDFESETAWTFDFTPWTVNDVDGLPTYGFTNVTFPNNYEPMAYIVFNPATTDPPMTDDPEIQPHGGAQFGACMASVPSGGVGNDDWFISDQIEIGTDAGSPSFTFWAKSYTDEYGLERFNVCVSTTGNDPGDFTVISGTTYLEAPIVWTEYVFDLTAYAGQAIYVAIQCVSYDAFVFMIDDLVINPGEISEDCDDFDSYTAGELLCPQSDLWTTWDDNPGGPYDGYVTDEESLSPPNSLSIDLAVLESDLIYNLHQKTEGRWEVSLDILIPNDTCGGYYNIMQEMTLFGTANKWGFEVYFRGDGTGFMEDAANNTTDFTYTVGQWTHSTVNIDLDNATAEFLLDGIIIHTWQWDISGPNTLGVIDIYAAADGDDDPKCYIDNVCMFELPPIGIESVAPNGASLSIYPNPVRNDMTVTSSDRMQTVIIVNPAGQILYQQDVSGYSLQLNTQNYAPGLYIMKVRTENGLEMKKFMKR